MPLIRQPAPPVAVPPLQQGPTSPTPSPLPPTHTHHNPTGLFAANAAGALWWLGDQLLRHGPSWELIPPLLLATAALLGAVRSYLDGAQARRIALEEHHAKLGCLRRLPSGPPGLERLN